MNTNTITAEHAAMLPQNYQAIQQEHKSPAINQDQLILKPVADTQAIVDSWNEYQELKARLLIESDYATIQWKKLICKSWWRKLQTAFWISDKLISEKRNEYEGKVVFEVTVEVKAPNWRTAFWVWSCDSSERNFSKQEHDCRSVAHTRAKNRALSDLIGGWEVSFEEMTGGTGNHNTSYSNSTPTWSTSYASSPSPWYSYSSASSKSRTNYVNQPGYKSTPANTSDSSSNSWSTPELMSSAQRNLLIRLIEKKYVDEETRSTMFNQIKNLSKKEASLTIQSLLSSK